MEIIEIQYKRALPGKKVLGVERTLKMGGTTNTIFQEKRCWGGPTQFSRKKGVGVDQHNFIFFCMVQSIWIFQETPPTHRILIDFSSTPDALFPGTALRSKVIYISHLI